MGEGSGLKKKGLCVFCCLTKLPLPCWAICCMMPSDWEVCRQRDLCLHTLFNPFLYWIRLRMNSDSGGRTSVMLSPSLYISFWIRPGHLFYFLEAYMSIHYTTHKIYIHMSLSLSWVCRGYSIGHVWEKYLWYTSVLFCIEKMWFFFLFLPFYPLLWVVWLRRILLEENLFLKVTWIWLRALMGSSSGSSKSMDGSSCSLCLQEITEAQAFCLSEYWITSQWI